MIERFHAENLRAFRDMTVDLSPLTVIVGPNGGGKTTVLQGMNLLARLVRERAGDVFLSDKHALASLQRVGSEGPMELRFETKRTSLVFVSKWTKKDEHPVVAGTAPHRAWSYSLTAEIRRRGGAMSLTLQSEPRVARSLPPDSEKLVQDYISPLGSAALLQLDARRLSAPSYSDQEVPQLRSDGAGLASVLAFLKLSSSERFDAIEAALRSIVPSVRAIRIRKQKTLRDEYGKLKRERTVQEYVGDAIVFDTSSGSDLPASACSEGTMFVLGLLTVILGPQRPRLLLLDDIDHALHPRAQEKLSNEIRAFMSQCPDLQIVATSHSPLLLDHLTHDEVRITNINDDGTVTIGRLDEHAKFSRWKDEMTPGEFWSMVGEKWLSETSATSAGK